MGRLRATWALWKRLKGAGGVLEAMLYWERSGEVHQEGWQYALALGLGAGTYSALAVLEGSGLVESAWEQEVGIVVGGEGRRVYRLTEAGRRAAEALERRGGRR